MLATGNFDANKQAAEPDLMKTQKLVPPQKPGNSTPVESQPDESAFEDGDVIDPLSNSGASEIDQSFIDELENSMSEEISQDKLKA